MTPFEWLALGYFGAIAASGRRAPRRLRGWLYAAGAALLVIVARFAMPWEARAWMPHAYLVLGYWIPAVFTPVPPDERFEQWLIRADARLGNWEFGGGLFELAYLLCYPVVPAAFAVVFAWGTADDVTRFWTAVLTAGYVCYGTLPWTAARPPRLMGRPEGRPLQMSPAAPSLVARLNTYVLGRFSHQLNTFPSGHVAVSVAAALVVCTVSPLAGAPFVLVAAAIAVAAVAGRYHYRLDVLLGAAIGAAGGLSALVT